MKTTIQGIGINIVDLTDNMIPALSEALSEWQTNEQFLRFIKEKPMSPQENIQVITKTLAEEKSIYKLILEDTQQKIIWCILFDTFDVAENSLESYTRIDPNFSKKWFGTQCRRKIISDILLWGGVEKIISRHSARNTASLIINKRAWFRLIDFVPGQTFLPNTNKMTDDFKREITKEDIINGTSSEIIKMNADRVNEWLKKHNLWDLLHTGR